MSHLRDILSRDFYVPEFLVLCANSWTRRMCHMDDGEEGRHEWQVKGILSSTVNPEYLLMCQGVPKIKRDKYTEKRTHWGAKPPAQDKMALEQRLRDGKNFMFKTINRSGSRTQVHINIQYRRRCGTIYNSYLSFFGFSVRSFLKYEEPLQKPLNASLLLQWFNYEEKLLIKLSFT